MIQIRRPPIPAPLAKRARTATDALWTAWRNGKKLNIKASIYAHSTVKTALRMVQHEKCAYCETLNPTSHDVVEHFRPKNGWRHQRGDALQSPEYFWLAYEWENLLFACDRCNDGGHKQNVFPLRNPTARATANAPDTRHEQPLLLNPYGGEDPEQHIEWNRDVPRSRNGSEMGRASIETFGLAEDSLLLRQRRKHLERTEMMIALAEAAPVGPARGAMRQVFLEYIGPTGPWSAMMRANLEARILAL